MLPGRRSVENPMHPPFILAVAALLGSATLAAAQPSPPPAPPPAASDAPAQPQPSGDGMRERMHGGPGMMREAYMRGMMQQNGPRAARFRFEKDGAMVGIQCANNETTRACVDAAGVLIDKLAPQPTR